MPHRVYLDHHAATPVDPRVRAALAELDALAWANPSSVHAEGRRSRAFLERARSQVAQAIGAVAADVVYTSGGTEACNLAVQGVLAGRERMHVVTTTVEHPAVAEPLRSLELQGAITVTRLALPKGRAPEPEALRAALCEHTALCAVQWVNHETGTILPVQAYAAVCQAAGVPCFVDATQAFGKLPLSVALLAADLVALAAHKIGGGAGAGALWVRRGLELQPVSHGGSQERGRRGGTPDVRAAVGFGAACELVAERLADMPRLARLRDRLELGLLQLGAVANAPDGTRVATCSNVYWPGRRSDALIAALDLEGVAISAGSACSSGTSEPSPVLLGMHADEPARAEASTRFSFGVEVTDIDVDFALERCARVVARPNA
jgi:cysteine desulfurase